MDCRATPAVDFTSRLGFKQHDLIIVLEFYKGNLKVL